MKDSDEEEYVFENRTGSVIVRGVPRAAWIGVWPEVFYLRKDGVLVCGGPKINSTYASKGSEVDLAREQEPGGVRHR